MEFPPFRPPSEAHSYLIRVVRGCNWNKCLFCSMYKAIDFEQRPKEDILKDIDEIPRYFPKSKSAFLGDSNPLIHKDIVEIVRYLKLRRPEVERITAYARIKTIANMPEEKLRDLKSAGLTRLHMGLESGDDEILRLVQKGITAEDAIKAGKKAGKFFETTYYVITGLGGVERSEKHAKNTARVINEAKPTFVRIRNLTITNPEMEGVVKLLNAEEQLEELRNLLEGIKVETYFTCDHISNYLFTNRGAIFTGVHGKLPEEKEDMLKIIEDTLETVKALKKSGVEVFTSNDMFRFGFISL
ncbi:MAG: radical SAM protein [Archaeoglobaceae archaeon]|nr:radical SAM protein [Archaeoglobaceae archaeon]MDW8128112.1 radical SAM protein [Archaeoglobaceae archaeon]